MISLFNRSLIFLDDLTIMTVFNSYHNVPFSEVLYIQYLTVTNI